MRLGFDHLAPMDVKTISVLKRLSGDAGKATSQGTCGSRAKAARIGLNGGIVMYTISYSIAS